MPAHFVGCKIGKHKLNPAVSPKKTVEGAIGGVVFGAVSAIVYGLIVQHMCSACAPVRMAGLCGICNAFSQWRPVASLIKPL